MPAGTFIFYDSVAELIGDGTIDLDSDTFKIALLASTYTPDAAHDEWADVSSHEIAGSFGYTTGGATLANVTWSQTGGVATFSSDNQVWTASGGNIAARYGVIYDDTTTGDKLLGYYLLDDAPADLVATPPNTFTVGPDVSEGWGRLRVNP
jgi:hypothetical protein